MNTILSLLSLSAGLLNSSAPTPLLSPSASNSIGFFIETQPVATNTWIRIDPSDQDTLRIADEVGRQIRVDYINNIPSLSYLATPELGKITGYREIFNDYDSFIYMIGQLYNYSENIYHSQSPFDDVCGYFRSFRTSYQSRAWNTLAGSVNSDFVASVRTLNQDSLTFETYFKGCTQCDKNGNSFHHSPTDQEKFNVVSPYHSDKTIDVCHLIASIDGISSWPEFFGVDAYDNRYMYGVFDDIFSWAGDLQTGYANYMKTNGSVPDDFSFESLLNDQDSYFPYEDFVADMIATEVAFSMKTRSGDTLYQGLFNNNYWYDTYLETVGSFTCELERFNYENLTSHDEFDQIYKDKIYSFMGVKLDENGTLIEFGDGEKMIKYYLMTLENPDPNMRLDYRHGYVNDRAKFAQAFIDYLEGILYEE